MTVDRKVLSDLLERLDYAIEVANRHGFEDSRSHTIGGSYLEWRNLQEVINLHLGQTPAPDDTKQLLQRIQFHQSEAYRLTQLILGDPVQGVTFNYENEWTRRK